MSWNSSIMSSAKRPAQRSRNAGSAASRSRTRSSRSSKSTPARAAFALVVRAREALEQVVEQHEHGPGVVVGAGRAVLRPDLAVGGAVVVLERAGAARQLRGVELGRQRDAAAARNPLRRLERVERLTYAHAARDADAAAGGGGRRGQRRAVRRGGLERDRQPRMRVPTAAQRRVRLRDHQLELAPVRRGDVDRRAAVRPHPALERGLEGGERKAPRRALLEDGEARIESGRERLCAQQPCAEPMDRADPRRVDGASVLGLPQLGEAAPDPLAQLGRRLLGEGQREDGGDGHLVAQHRLGEPLHHHRGLAGAGAGSQQRRAGAVADRRPLLGGERPHAGASRPGSPARQIAG